jgi:PAS domain S-box-containing protein
MSTSAKFRERRAEARSPAVTEAPSVPMRVVENREWWLWGLAVTVTLVLTLGIVSLTFPGFHFPAADWLDLKERARALAALVLIFDIYTLYQHLQLQRIRRQLAERDHLFQLITENAADMIAVVDAEGHRLYNSPSYEKVLGYSAQELKSSSIGQIHPDDRQRVIEAAEKARVTGRGERLEYRMCHKDGSWRILESTASVVRNIAGVTTRLVIVNRDITDRKRAEERLAHNAFHDHLTNLPNRALFIDRLQHALTLAQRHSNYRLAVLFIDIDEFKVLNDSLGHVAGDQLLIGIGRRLTTSLREMDTVSRPRVAKPDDSPATDDTVARLGGDEFTVLLDDIRDPSDAIRVAQRIQERWTIPFVINGQEVVITPSIGIALSTPSSFEAEDLLRDAEIAMYRAKQAGKARCELFDPAMHAAAVQRLRLETDLRKALELGEFVVYYQPIVSLQSGKIAGFEALTRWQRPAGMVLPADFIPVADETGLILPMNRLLMQEASRQLRSWHSEFPSEPPLFMSVNISSKQFAQSELATDIGLILKQAGLDPSCLQVEITETITMGDEERGERVLSELKALGVRISIDDFGTGYSSLSRLQGFPVDSLKIDRAFISNMDTDSESREIVRIIIMLAHNLGLKVVAEGTETAEQVSQLKQLGCEMVQGYFFSKPVDQQAISGLLQRQGRPQAVASTLDK